MDAVVDFLIKAFQIVLINIALSGDNVGVIALAVRHLPPKKAKAANLIGVSAATLLRIVFVIIVEWLYTLTWLHVDMIGGVVLLLITLGMLRDEQKQEEKTGGKNTGGVLQAVAVIIAADVSMSLDNVLAITSIAMSSGSGRMNTQELALVLFGLAVCIPIIFFGSEFVAKLMDRFTVILYLCAGVLIYTGIKMIFEDVLVARIVPFSGAVGFAAALLCGAAVIIYGVAAAIRQGKVKKVSD